MTKKTEVRKTMKDLFYKYYTLADIARLVGVSRQRVKDIIDSEVDLREQRYVKAMRANEKRYLREIKNIKNRYGKQ